MSLSINDYKDLEIVGFDGSLHVACGRFLPIVRDKSTDRFYKLSPRRGADSTMADYSPEQIKALSADNQITLLSTARPAFPLAMVVFVSQQALDSASVQLPIDFAWQEIPLTGWVGCNVDEQSLAFLSKLARVLMAKATEELVDFFASQQESSCLRAKELIDMARAATTGMAGVPTRDLTLRAQILLRYAIALKYSNTPERLDNVFELAIHREFPEWTWESFQTRVTRLSEMLHDQAFSRGIDSENKVRSTYMMLTISKSIGAVKSVEEDAEKVRTCEERAEAFRTSYEVPQEEIDNVTRELLSGDGIRVTDSALRVLAGEPVFYYLCSKQGIKLAPEGSRPLLSVFDFHDCSREFTERGGTVGKLARGLELEGVMYA